MNRPFGAVDVSANLKGSVPKTATQKILLALADKGEVTQKVYGESIALLSKWTCTAESVARMLWFQRCGVLSEVHICTYMVEARYMRFVFFAKRLFSTFTGGELINYMLIS